jgi:hypothetical protein
VGITRRSRGAWLAVGAGVALGIGGVVVAGHATQEATGQSAAGVRVSAEQLAINQRISQAAVRRANESLRLLGPIRPRTGQPGKPLGWRSQDLSEGLREGQPRWAVVGGDGTLARQKGATAVVRTQFGRYRVTFDRSVAACALSATVAVVAPEDPVLFDRVPTLGVDPADPAVVTVRIFQASNPAVSEDAPFHLTVLC